MTKESFDSRVLAEVAVSVALAYVLNLIIVYSLPQGGSITLGSMVPILLLALRRGPKIGIFGGTFDPVHNGHIRIAEEAKRRLELDEVLLVGQRQAP